MQPKGKRNPGVGSFSPQAEWVRRLGTAGTVLALLYIFSRFIPSSSYQDYVIFDETDNSWSMAFHEAFVRYFQSGTEFVFTYGPWGFLARGYHPQTYLMAVIVWSGLALAFVIGGWRLARSLGCNQICAWLWLTVLAGLATTPLGNDIDARLLLYAVLLLLLHFLTDDDDYVEMVVAVALGCLSLVKFTGLIESGIVLLLISAYDVIRDRRAPRLLLVWLASLLGFWLLAGQNLGNVGLFLSRSLQIAAGYTEAMQLPGKTGDWSLAGFLVLAAALGTLAARSVWGKLHGWTLFPLTGLVAMLFMAFKLGYVRRDVHELNAAMALLVLAVLLLPVAWRERREVKIAALALLAVAGIFAAMIFKFWVPGNELAWQFATTFRPTSLLAPVLATSTGHLSSDYEKMTHDSSVKIKIEPAFHPAFDLYSYRQVVLFAHGLKYQPRPVPQSYSAYTPELAELNADSLRTPLAPGGLLFAVQPLDDRFPALDDGLSWPELWTRYRPYPGSGADNAFLLLERQKTSRPFRRVALTNLPCRFGQVIAIPGATNSLVWAEVDVRQTFAGKLAAAFYKPPIVALNVTFTDGSTHRYRLVPGMARAGFLLSPVISDNQSFAALYGNDWRSELGSREVASMEIEPETVSHTSVCYEPEYQVRFSRLEISGP